MYQTVQLLIIIQFLLLNSIIIYKPLISVFKLKTKLFIYLFDLYSICFSCIWLGKIKTVIFIIKLNYKKSMILTKHKKILHMLLFKVLIFFEWLDRLFFHLTIWFRWNIIEQVGYICRCEICLQYFSKCTYKNNVGL